MKLLAFALLAILALSEAKIGKVTSAAPGDTTVGVSETPGASGAPTKNTAAPVASSRAIPVTVPAVVSTAAPSAAPTAAPTVAASTPAPIVASTAQPTVAPTTAQPIAVSTNAPTQRPTGPPTTAAPAGLDFGCTCNTTAVWNDVMFLFDNSASTGQRDLTDLLFTFRSIADSYTIAEISSTNPQVMRAGIITYASSPKLEYALGSITTDQIVNGTFSPSVSNGDFGTNLKDAIKMATQQLRGANHRETSKQVIVIFATTFNPAGDSSPLSVADEFKEDGGIIVTYDYVPNGGEDSTLKRVASPGYDISSSQVDSYDRLLDSQCDANCYCPNNYQPYASSGARKTPNGGCYWPVTAPSNEILAQSRCSMYNVGELVKVESADKNAFVNKLFSPPRSYYIGATYDSFNKQWLWPDGKPLTYTNWCKTPTDTSLQCAFASQTSNFCWMQTSCRNAYGYVCEASPCDSTHYCANN